MRISICLFLGLIACPFFILGCVTEYNLATREEEFIYYSTEKEVKLGESIAKQIEEENEFVDDPLIEHRVEEIGKKIASVCDRQDIDYHFYVLEEDEEANAFSLPGGFVYINKSLIDKISTDDELAAVLAHEIGHIVARHSVKKLQAVMGYSFLRILIAVAPVKGSGSAAKGADLAFAEILSGYSREDEMLADQLAARYIKKAGYDPYAMLSLLEKLQEINRRRPLRPLSYYKTHPYVPDRIRVVKQELGEEITFDDYINVEQLPHGQ
jgi:predicted Zn-dependent protease